MARILVVDDRVDNRELLTVLLGYRGHHVLEACDGCEALATAKASRPDLIISDILMPSMDGYEFVRHLRADQAIKDTPVIFSSAYYQGREASSLAEACGVRIIVAKPIEPEAFLAMIDDLLITERSPVWPPPPLGTFDGEHRRLLTDTLAVTADALQSSNQRLAELIQVGLRLGAATCPNELLQDASRAVRSLAGARLGAAAAIGADGETVQAHGIAGVPQRQEDTAWLSIPPGTVCREVIEAGTATKLECLNSSPAPLGLPSSVPRIDSFLGAPLATPTRKSGVVCVANKIGSAFSTEDEDILRIVGAQAGRTLENMALLKEASDRSEELRRASEAKTRLLACASHDLRQPLQALRMFIDLLAQEENRDRAALLVANADKALSGAEALLNTLMEVSRFDSGTIPVHSETFPLSQVLDALAVECAPVAAEKGLSLRVRRTDVTLHTDPVLLHRAIRNLVWNAIRYTDRGGVLVGCRKRGACVAIEVWDTGRGIPSDRLDAIFDDFYRIEERGRDRTEGLGLGLSIVARKARLLGARVAVRSRPGRGSVFSFIVPVCDVKSPTGL